MKQIFFTVSLLIVLANQGDSLYCYRCNSNHPGCGTPLNWLWYWGETCPEYDDKCVKIIERKGAETIITRECLSSVRSFRTDIPADHYEGCRSAAKDVRLGHYVNNSIHQLDIHRDYYDEVTWCFCYFDHRCNSAEVMTVSMLLIILEIAVQYFIS
ncbi:hypothetical protein ALC60_04487 [Trachymyrmex zeteki]|uniref:Uncharacterized protein n=1 Tax=Mycetomoellerius zeteki TaxID=64791 RepID=A0A151X886_9HYME|nr:PREDICTED: uncharacterized protein LOC108721685 [Trachymyrmex zeteki]KYQ56582.1 hypothetical protein ALC60_04487 [Trachymyrmex zeteki]